MTSYLADFNLCKAWLVARPVTILVLRGLAALCHVPGVGEQAHSGDDRLLLLNTLVVSVLLL